MKRNFIVVQSVSRTVMTSDTTGTTSANNVIAHFACKNDGWEPQRNFANFTFHVIFCIFQQTDLTFVLFGAKMEFDARSAHSNILATWTTASKKMTVPHDIGFAIMACKRFPFFLFQIDFSLVLLKETKRAVWASSGAI